MNNINEEKLSSIDRCYELIKEKHSNWIGISNQEAIKSIIIDRDMYKTLYESILAQNIEETSRNKKKHENDLELLNEGWKQKLKDSIKKSDLRTLLIQKLNKLDNIKDHDKEENIKLIIEIKLLKSILGE